MTDRLREIEDDTDANDERKVLDTFLALLEKESEAGKKVKDTTKALEIKVAAKYGKLNHC